MHRLSVDGTFTTTNKLPRPGGSGSGIFSLEYDRHLKATMFLKGIHQSKGGRGIQILEIEDRLSKDNPKVYDEVKRAIENGTCN